MKFCPGWLGMVLGLALAGCNAQDLGNGVTAVSPPATGTGTGGNNGPGSSIGTGSGPTGTGTGGGSPAEPFAPVRTLSVCPSGCAYSKPSEAFAAAQDYDLIEIQAGDYVDCGTLSAAHLWVKGTGGMAHVRDVACGGKAIWITQGADITIENVEFSGMTVPDQNGAGIRHEGQKLTLRNVYMHDGEEGILAGANGGADVIIDGSRFENLGLNGYAHGIYINQVRSFTLTRSTVIRSKSQGHEVKSRALKSDIECNVLAGEDGVDSYTLDMPNGGGAYVRNNLIEQGPNTSNHTIFSYGEEGALNPSQTLEVTGNILINDYPSVGTFLNIVSNPSTVSVSGNVVIGPGTFLAGAGAANVTQSGNTIKPDRASAGITEQYPLPPGCN